MPSSLVNGAVKGLFNISKRLTVRKGAVIVFEVGQVTDPANPVEGMLYYNSDTNVFRYYNGTAWVTITAA